MKIKNVCERTGLSDRTIRFYIDEGLIDPAYKENYLGRKTLDFSEDNVTELQDIGTLRKVGFSVAQIRLLIHDPKEFPRILSEIRLKKQNTIDSERYALASMAQLDPESPYTIRQLAQLLGSQKNTVHHEQTDENSPAPYWLITTLRVIAVLVLGMLGLAAMILITDMAVFYFSEMVWNKDTPLIIFLRTTPFLLGESILIGVVTWLVRWVKLEVSSYRNNSQPVLTIRATLTQKELSTQYAVFASFYNRDGGEIASLTFRTDTGEILELYAPRKEYYRLSIGSKGQLTYQGEKLWRFLPE